MKSVISHATSALIGGITTATLYYKLSSITIENGNTDNDDELSSSRTFQIIKPKNNNNVVAGSKSKNNSPISPITIFYPNPTLEIAFDARTRNPLYALETITKQNLTSSSSIKNAENRKGQRFTEEKSLLECHRSRNGYYRKSGFDRGHLAPAADFPMDMDSTFNLCNVSPQVSSFNRGIWAKLEDLVRKVAVEDESDTTFVVTGPLWLPSKIIKQPSNDLPLKYEFKFEAIGTPPSLIYVPSHFFKVIVVTNKQGLVQKFAAFLLPNKDIYKNNINLRNFVVRITDLEAISGISFSPLLQLFSKSFKNEDYTIEEVKDLVDSMTDDVLHDNNNKHKNNRIRQIPFDDDAKDALILSSNLGIKKKLNGKKMNELKKIVQHICDRSDNSSIKKHSKISRC